MITIDRCCLLPWQLNLPGVYVLYLVVCQENFENCCSHRSQVVFLENRSTHDIVARMTPTNKEAFLEKEGMRVKKKNEETICTCFPISVS